LPESATAQHTQTRNEFNFMGCPVSAAPHSETTEQEYEMNKVWIGAAVVAVLAVGAGGYYAVAMKMQEPGATKSDAKGSKADKGESSEKKAEVPLALSALDVTKAAPAVLAHTLAISGSVEASRQAMVRSRHSGIATSVGKRAGEAVRQGELLLRVDSEELRLRIGEREASVRQAQAALTVAESARNQQRSLADRGFISKAALDSVESNFIAARTALETAQSQLSMARSQLAETAISAPITGVIAKRSVEPGERVSGEQQVFHVIDPNSLEVAVQIPAERASEIRVGQIATFRIDSASGNERVDAKLVRIVPAAAAGARTIETRFALPQGSPIPAGAFLSGQIVLAKKETAVALPRTAIRGDGNGHYVWSVVDGKIVRVRVKVNDLDGGSDQVGIDAGVAANSVVLLLRGADPREGQRVTLPNAAATPPANVPLAPAAPAAKS
jgi:RND family efflux transporter MFP subunit